MVNEQPKVTPQARYNVSQTAALLGMHRNTITRKTEAGQLRCGYRKDTMARFYKGAEIIRFWRQEM